MDNQPTKRYKDQLNEEQRRQECDNIKKCYPDKIPLIIEKHPKSKLEQIDRTKQIKMKFFQKNINKQTAIIYDDVSPMK